MDYDGDVISLHPGYVEDSINETYGRDPTLYI